MIYLTVFQNIYFIDVEDNYKMNYDISYS